MSTATTQGQQYTINFVNNSMNSGSAVLFQTDENAEMARMLPLAWFCRYIQPGMQTSFSWTLDYCFVWGKTGSLRPGVTFKSAQMVPAGLNQNNQITFAQAGFKDQRTANPGKLSIVEDADIPREQMAVGIGMSGSGSFVAQATPSMNIMFTPNPKYWIAFGNYQAGAILNVDSIDNRIEIVFGPGKSSVTVTLSMNNNFSVSYS